MEFQKDVDARGMKCPLPILKAKKALNDMQTGEILRVMATDPGSVRDFNAFARQTGNELLSHEEQDAEFTLTSIWRLQVSLGWSGNSILPKDSYEGTGTRQTRGRLQREGAR